MQKTSVFQSIVVFGINFGPYHCMFKAGTSELRLLSKLSGKTICDDRFSLNNCSELQSLYNLGVAIIFANYLVCGRLIHVMVYLLKRNWIAGSHV